MRVEGQVVITTEEEARRKTSHKKGPMEEF